MPSQLQRERLGSELRNLRKNLIGELRKEAERIEGVTNAAERILQRLEKRLAGWST